MTPPRREHHEELSQPDMSMSDERWECEELSASNAPGISLHKPSTLTADDMTCEDVNIIPILFQQGSLTKQAYADLTIEQVSWTTGDVFSLPNQEHVMMVCVCLIDWGIAWEALLTLVDLGIPRIMDGAARRNLRKALADKLIFPLFWKFAASPLFSKFSTCLLPNMLLVEKKKSSLFSISQVLITFLQKVRKEIFNKKTESKTLDQESTLKIGVDLTMKAGLIDKNL